MSSSAHSALASLNAYADETDSEPEEDVEKVEEVEVEGGDEIKNVEPEKENISISPSPPPPADESNSRDAQSVSSAGDSKSGGSNPLGLVSYQDDLIDDDVVDDFDHNSDSLQENENSRTEEMADSSGIIISTPDTNIVDLEDVTQDKDLVEGEGDDQPQSKKVKLPPEPTGKCPSELQDKFTRMFERKAKTGFNMNQLIQGNKQFRNPSIYEKLIIRCNIDELGTNYPRDIYDPHVWDETSHYDELAKAQKTEMERREKERKERTKVEFVSGTVKKTVAISSGAPAESEPKRKSKWDQKGVMPVFGAAVSAPAVQPVQPQPTFTSNASGTKGTVINAFGSLPKKSNK